MYKLLSKIIFSKLTLLSLLTAYNLFFFLKDGYVYFLIFLFIFLLIYLRFDVNNKDLFIDSLIFSNIFSAILPAQKPFSGIQFSYFDYLYLENIIYDPIVYADTYRYIGFHLFSKLLLFSNNLANLNVGLYFLNFLIFYSIFYFYQNGLKARNKYLFMFVFLFFLLLINLPSQFNSYMGVGKLFLNGIAGFGNFGFRTFAPASFDLLIFYPLAMLLQNKIRNFIITGILLSLFHYYLFLILVISLVSYLSYKSQKNYLMPSIIFSILLFALLEQIEIFQYLSDVVIGLKKNYYVNVNLIPVISFGTIINSGTDNSFLYYFNYENLSFFKPAYITSNFSPSLGVFNGEASIPIEKIIFTIVCISILRKAENKLIFNFVIYYFYTYLISSILFSLNIFIFQGFIYPWRINLFLSVLCFMVFLSCINFELKYYKFVNIILLITIPLSFYVWSFYTNLDVDYNIDIASEVRNIPNGSKVLMPLNETKYAYEYNLPNFYISYFHPIDWLNKDLMDEYFKRSEHYKNIYASESCLDITNYVIKNNLDISYIFVKQNQVLDKENCQSSIYLYSEN